MAIAKTTECISAQIMFNRINGTFQAYFQSAEVIYDGDTALAATPTGNTLSINTHNVAPLPDVVSLEKAINDTFARLYAESIASPPAPEVDPDEAA